MNDAGKMRTDATKDPEFQRASIRFIKAQARVAKVRAQMNEAMMEFYSASDRIVSYWRFPGPEDKKKS